MSQWSDRFPAPVPAHLRKDGPTARASLHQKRTDVSERLAGDVNATVAHVLKQCERLSDIAASMAREAENVDTKTYTKFCAPLKQLVTQFIDTIDKHADLHRDVHVARTSRWRARSASNHLIAEANELYEGFVHASAELVKQNEKMQNTRIRTQNLSDEDFAKADAAGSHMPPDLSPLMVKRVKVYAPEMEQITNTIRTELDALAASITYAQQQAPQTRLF